MKRIALVLMSCFALIIPGFALAQDDETAVMVADSEEFGPILTDAEGMTLYLFTVDEPGKSNCYDDCAVNWPPLLSDNTALPEGTAGELTTVMRDDGETQLAYNGWPLYYWIADEAPGDTTGHLVGDVWFVVEVGDETTPPAAMTEEPRPRHRQWRWAAIMVGETDELGQFLTDAEGMTLYIFSNDEAGLGRECLQRRLCRQLATVLCRRRDPAGRRVR